MKNIDTIIENIITDKIIQHCLSEFGVDSSLLQDLLKRFYRLGKSRALFSIRDLKNAKHILEIYCNSPKGWTEEDKFIAMANFLEYESKMSAVLKFKYLLFKIETN
jgi:hypothetical protein